MILIDLKNISKIYNNGKSNAFHALDNVSLEISQGEMVAIQGPSGSGKSTLMHIVGLLDRPTRGEYFLEGKKVGALKEKERAILRGQSIGFIFQFFNLLPRTSALNNVILPAIYQKRKDRKKRAYAILTQLRLEKRANHKSNQLSGGEQQRVAIGRALMNNPKIILADEPTGNLDSKSGQEILDILKSLNKDGVTVILVTHENRLAQEAERIIKLKDGRIVE